MFYNFSKQSAEIWKQEQDFSFVNKGEKEKFLSCYVCTFIFFLMLEGLFLR